MEDEYRIQAIIESSENDLLKMEISDLEQQLAERDELIEIALTALEYYANRMDTGGTARNAIKKIESEVESE